MPRGVHDNHARASAHPRWNRAIRSSDGYVKVRVGTNHPLADPMGYAYEHLLVWAAAQKRLPRTDELLHHRDDDKTNNRLGNLELMTRSEHARLHADKRTRDTGGRFAAERKAA